MAGGGSGSKKSKKVGKCLTYCKFYKATKQREKNKVRKMAKHLKRFPDDLAAVERMKIIKIEAGIR